MKVFTATVAVMGFLSLAACTSQRASQDSATPSQTATVSVARDVNAADWCGDKPLKVGLSDGFGGNAWRQISFVNRRPGNVIDSGRYHLIAQLSQI